MCSSLAADSMCRNIKRFSPSNHRNQAEEQLRAYVEEVTASQPSHTNEQLYTPVEDTRDLGAFARSLETLPAKNREDEAAKAKALSARDSAGDHTYRCFPTVRGPSLGQRL